MQETVTIILTPVDAEMFKIFQKYYEFFKMMEDSKAMRMEFGKCIINIAFGEVQNVVKEEVVWKRKI